MGADKHTLTKLWAQTQMHTNTNNTDTNTSASASTSTQVVHASSTPPPYYLPWRPEPKHRGAESSAAQYNTRGASRRHTHTHNHIAPRQAQHTPARPPSHPPACYSPCIRARARQTARCLAVMHSTVIANFFVAKMWFTVTSCFHFGVYDQSFPFIQATGLALRPGVATAPGATTPCGRGTPAQRVEPGSPDGFSFSWGDVQGGGIEGTKISKP